MTSLRKSVNLSIFNSPIESEIIADLASSIFKSANSFKYAISVSILSFSICVPPIVYVAFVLLFFNVPLKYDAPQTPIFLYVNVH